MLDTKCARLYSQLQRACLKLALPTHLVPSQMGGLPGSLWTLVTQGPLFPKQVTVILSKLLINSGLQVLQNQYVC